MAAVRILLSSLPVVFVAAANALAAAPDAGSTALTSRETFLAAAICAITACGLSSFFLAGRVSERTHVALSLVTVLIGTFSLFVLFGLAGRQQPWAGALVVLGLIGLFKLMNQFEIRRKNGGPGR